MNFIVKVILAGKGENTILITTYYLVDSEGEFIVDEDFQYIEDNTNG